MVCTGLDAALLVQHEAGGSGHSPSPNRGTRCASIYPLFYCCFASTLDHPNNLCHLSFLTCWKQLPLTLQDSCLQSQHNIFFTWSVPWSHNAFTSSQQHQSHPPFQEHNLSASPWISPTSIPTIDSWITQSRTFWPRTVPILTWSILYWSLGVRARVVGRRTSNLCTVSSLSMIKVQCSSRPLKHRNPSGFLQFLARTDGCPLLGPRYPRQTAVRVLLAQPTFLNLIPQR